MCKDQFASEETNSCCYSRSYSCYSCHRRVADSDNSESNLLKAAEYSPTDLNAREMFRRKEQKNL
jgi:hypothetical protein